MKEKILWHHCSLEKVWKMLESEHSGLNEQEVIARKQRFGSNSLPEKTKKHFLQILFSQLLNPLIYVLIFAGIMAFLFGEIKDGFFIFLVILINSILGAFQEWKAEKMADSLKNYLVSEVVVKREGLIKKIPAAQLVPGDLILLESGQKVPADARLIEENNLLINESLLTGESLPIRKQTNIVREDASIGDRINCLYAGTTVISGRGLALVFNTGVNTELGNIAMAVEETESEKPPLIQRMEKFSKQLSLIILLLIAILAIHAYIEGLPAQEVMMLAIALAVAAIPESLPIAMTVVLSVASKKMASRKAIVRKLTAVEGLGSCTVIATDKTGTLTENKMRLDQLWSWANGGEEALLEKAVLASEIDLATWKSSQPIGDSVDIAIVQKAEAAKVLTKLKENFLLEKTIPFESEHKFTARAYSQAGKQVVFIKGALEVLLPASQLSDGEKEEVTMQMSDLASKGYRVLALAEASKIANIDWEKKTMHSLSFLGLLGLIDPLRSEVPAAVKACQIAGIRVVMITGDHPDTALAIGRQLSLVEDPSHYITTGLQLEKAGDPTVPGFLDLVERTRIFARVSPLQKMQIVEAMAKNGHFVAVTGDGANDAPAIKKANLGIALGSGTDAAKEASSMVILDDNFATIEAGVEEGRYAYDNIRKITYLVLCTSLTEIILFVLSFIRELPLPLLPIQLLWLNLVTNSIRDIGLAFESGETEAMSRPPRKTTESLINGLMIRETLVSSIYLSITSFLIWEWALRMNMGEPLARNLLMLFLVVALNLQTFNCRSETKSIFKIPLASNWTVVFCIILTQFIHLVGMYWAPLADLLKLSPVDLQQWIIVLAFSLLLIFTMEIYKFWERRKMT